ncbi:putative MFS allantoate transporter [Neohortaea acidophila]|uniref:Putative MFS allantoate transporter n=1 Tax=Neohortaea acidophila TaxID=245834 RepID=A0A6A6Q4I3_9PEZI|nr:putative MFS allantoate transporter [Neohortaea acidophila]KAF2487202.1 putative MFS allantoate transporter [Neohortaea acidophila]
MADIEKAHDYHIDPELEKKVPPAYADAIRRGSVPEEILKHSHDADEALKAVQLHEGQVLVLDEATNKRILRRIDYNLLPVMCVVYGLNFLDKVSISYAAIMGLEKDIGLKGNEYEWLGSMFYFGYIAWEYPTNRLLQRLPIGKYSAGCVIAWGAVLTCFAGVTDFGGAVAVRFFLGVCESAVTPGFALITSQWYTKKEQGTRTGIWFSFNGFAQIFGGLVAYGIAKGVNKDGASLAGWQIIFLTIGLLTMSIGIIFLFVVPDNQLNARWLSEEDRYLAIERIRVNQQGVGNKHFKWYQFREALTDPLTWAIVFYALVADIPNGGITNFFAQLIEGFGYTEEQSLLYAAPAGAVEVVTLVAGGFLGDRYGNRLLVSTFGLVTGITGVALIVGLPLGNDKGRLAGYYLYNAVAMPFVALLAHISSNIAGYTKKTTVAALYLIGYCVGNIIGPQVFRPQDAPRYIPAVITILCCLSVCLLDILFIYCYCRMQNKKKAAMRAEPGYVKLENQEFLDLTDRENPEFTYTL